MHRKLRNSENYKKITLYPTRTQTCKLPSILASNKFATKYCKRFPPHPNNISTLPRKLSRFCENSYARKLQSYRNKK